jgi:hypothetical protein
MKGHGMAIRAPSVRDAVFRAFYAKQDAIVQFQATLLGGGRQPSGLNMREAADAANTTEGVSLYVFLFPFASILTLLRVKTWSSMEFMGEAT